LRWMLVCHDLRRLLLVWFLCTAPQELFIVCRFKKRGSDFLNFESNLQLIVIPGITVDKSCCYRWLRSITGKSNNESFAVCYHRTSQHENCSNLKNFLPVWINLTVLGLNFCKNHLSSMTTIFRDFCREIELLLTTISRILRAFVPCLLANQRSQSLGRVYDRSFQRNVVFLTTNHPSHLIRGTRRSICYWDRSHDGLTI
jgi:hypothetical protein